MPACHFRTEKLLSAIASGNQTIVEVNKFREILRDDKWNLPRQPPNIPDCAEMIDKNSGIFVPPKPIREAWKSQTKGKVQYCKEMLTPLMILTQTKQ